MRTLQSVRVALVALNVGLLSPRLQAASTPLPANYYDSVNTSSQSALRQSLHNIIDAHTVIPYTSSSKDTWDVLNEAQQDPQNPNNIVDVYRNASYAKISGGTGAYNREHVWPRSHGVGSSGPDSTDCHNLFLSDSGYNNSRGNKPFGECISGCDVLSTLLTNGAGGAGDPNLCSGNGTTGRWETWSERRGDVARAMFYMDVRYDGSDAPDLTLTDNTSLVGTGNFSGLLSELLQWHVDDPVDQRDRDRNDVVFFHQRNRNPFVDHPEWVALVFTTGECLANSDCSDGLLCNGQEQCNNGLREPGAPLCQAQALCDEPTGTCAAAPAVPLQLPPWRPLAAALLALGASVLGRRKAR